ncbi:DUF4007 family protein [Bacillus infantis]|jgi:hypothetical protein|uniref:DUF4007 family protein n=1 Tax=Bacillus infantis TaxID=324767 RepID=UPI00101B6DFD|nr:DUF4007 family protein [Bacillus infantis]RYI26660.1 DUF4007 family protein [Bacillus infantis]
MGYGQHQSFYLRDRWLNKGIKNIKEDSRFFYDKEAFEKIGLGKNMVQSLRYWVLATRVAEEQFNSERKKVYKITNFGEILYKFDRFIQFSDSAAILHYHLSSSKEPSTAWYWFFNILNQTVISKDELVSEFIKWVNNNEEKKISEKSLKRDIDCLIKLYTAGHADNDPEEVIQSPLYKIGLVKESKGQVYKNNGNLEVIGLSALMYVLLKYKEKHDVDTITVEEIILNEALWGKVFNMQRATVINVLENLTHHPAFPITFTRTNNLDTIRIPKINPLEFLEYEYARKVEALK